MKVAVVYTSTTPELIADLERELRSVMPADVTIANYQDPSILAEVREHGYVTAPPAARLISMYMKAVSEGADAILNVCSSVGEVADAAQDIAKYTGIPIVRIDEEMCREAVRLGTRIGVMATLQTTLEPTKNTVRRVAREMNKHVTLVDALVEGGFGLNPEEFKQLMTKYAGEIHDQVDVILFAQGSMAYCEKYIHDKYQKPVLSSVRFGVRALRKALVAKGLLPE